MSESTIPANAAALVAASSIPETKKLFPKSVLYPTNFMLWGKRCIEQARRLNVTLEFNYIQSTDSYTCRDKYTRDPIGLWDDSPKGGSNTRWVLMYEESTDSLESAEGRERAQGPLDSNESYVAILEKSNRRLNRRAQRAESEYGKLISAHIRAAIPQQQMEFLKGLMELGEKLHREVTNHVI